MCIHKIHSAPTQSRIEEVYRHDIRHFSQLLSGDNWQLGIGTSVSVAVCHLQMVDGLVETNNGRMS